MVLLTCGFRSNEHSPSGTLTPKLTPTLRARHSALVTSLAGKVDEPRARFENVLRLAAYLAAHPGRIVPTGVLLEEVWGSRGRALTRSTRPSGGCVASSMSRPIRRSFIARQGHGYGFIPYAAPLSPGRVSLAHDLARPVSQDVVT